MTIGILLLVLAVALAGIAWALPREGEYYKHYSGWSFFLTMVAMFVAAGGASTIAVTAAEDYNQRHCEVIVPRETGLKTKYVRWHDCYVTLENGRTVPYDRWIEESDDD